MTDRIEAFDNFTSKSGILFITNIKKIYIPNTNLFLNSQEQLPLDFIPIIQYLVFQKAQLTTHEIQLIKPLTPNEILKINSKNYSFFHSKPDYYPEMYSNEKCLNIIVDALIIGKDPTKTKQCWKIFVDYNNLRKKYLLKKTNEIIKNLKNLSQSLSIESIALRGQLSLPGRIPNNDIDLIIFTENKKSNHELKREIKNIGKNLKLRRITWLEVDFQRNIDTSKQIFFNSKGKEDLDCYLTNATKELERVKNGTVDEWKWNCGVLQHAKPLLNKRNFTEFVKNYCSIQKQLKSK